MSELVFGKCIYCNCKSQEADCRFEYRFTCDNCLMILLYEIQEKNDFFGLKWINPNKQIPEPGPVVVLTRCHPKCILEIKLVFFKKQRKNQKKPWKYPYCIRTPIFGWYPIPKVISYDHLF